MTCARFLTSLILIFSSLVYCQAQQVDDASIARPAYEIPAKDYRIARQDKEPEAVDENKQQKSTQVPFGPWPRKSIHETRIDIRESNSKAPDDRSVELSSGSTGQAWNQLYSSPKVFAWAAPDIRYRPLYFEEVALERYGHTSGWYTQPIFSSVHFFKSVSTLPFEMMKERPFSCDYPLGYCRPGSCVETGR